MIQYFLSSLIIFLLFKLKILSKIINFFSFSKKEIKYNKIISLKNKFNINSTEKTNNFLRYIVKAPRHFNYNIINKDKIKKLSYNKTIITDDISKKVVECFVYNKYIYLELFYNNNKLKINNLDNLYNFHKFNLNKNNIIKYNILFKFYNDSFDKYLYIYIENNKLIKIKNYEEFDNIVDIIENKNNIFLIYNKNDYFIVYGDFININLNTNDIKNIFFKNKNDNKNFNILSNFDSIKIFFYVSTKLDFN